MEKKKPSLHFVEAINFELTYQCNQSCPHCLQHDFRQLEEQVWINTDSAICCMNEAKELGFARSGVNFTGGEPFLRESNLPELLNAAKCFGLNVRVNTNGWWGDQQAIAIGPKRFSGCREVVSWLKEQNISLLALSFDHRYETNPSLLNSVLNVMRECEFQGLHYQLLHTRSLQSVNSCFWERLEQETENQFNYMIPVDMEMVDLGAAASLEGICGLSQMYCEGKGFYRPQYLHINPHGGVRSCMYATGASWLGNINHETLFDIADNFRDNPVVDFFSNNCPSRSNLIYQIHKRKDVPKHPCSLAVKIAKSLEFNEKKVHSMRLNENINSSRYKRNWGYNYRAVY